MLSALSSGVVELSIDGREGIQCYKAGRDGPRYGQLGNKQQKEGKKSRRRGSGARAEKGRPSFWTRRVKQRVYSKSRLGLRDRDSSEAFQDCRSSTILDRHLKQRDEVEAVSLRALRIHQSCSE